MASIQPSSISHRMPVGITAFPPAGITVSTGETKSYPALPLVERFGSGKILFGSDNSVDGPDTYLHNRTGDRSLYQQYFHDLGAMIGRWDYENIMYRNAARLFGIHLH